MRDIKFRGKQKDNNEWVYGYYAIEDGSEFESPYGSSRHYIITKSSLIEVIPETIGQFTGMKDCNGKEVYERDIIECIGWEKECYIVEFKDYAFVAKDISSKSFINVFKHKPLDYIQEFQVKESMDDDPARV